VRDVATMTYGELIRTEELRVMQQEIPGASDSRFFVAAHQITELWFTIILHELGIARDGIDADDLAQACYRLGRVARGEDVLACHLRAIETISPGSFSKVRARLGSSSAFESVQFREIEFLSGLKDRRYLGSEKLTQAERERLEARLRERSLPDAFEDLLDRRGQPDLVAVVSGEGDPELRALIEGLLDHDHGFARWRHGHALMAERIIGYKPGTGGSMGVSYLQATTAKRFFPRLWEIRSAL
jgi:tryptophan 2,3-dioxygenase